MSETTWIDGVAGAVESTAVLMTANTVINLYSVTHEDILRLLKQGPDSTYYPHVVDGTPRIGNINSSFILLTPGTYKIVGTSASPVYVTYEAL